MKKLDEITLKWHAFSSLFQFILNLQTLHTYYMNENTRKKNSINAVLSRS